MAWNEKKSTGWGNNSNKKATWAGVDSRLFGKEKTANTAFKSKSVGTYSPLNVAELSFKPWFLKLMYVKKKDTNSGKVSMIRGEIHSADQKFIKLVVRHGKGVDAETSVVPIHREQIVEAFKYSA